MFAGSSPRLVKYGSSWPLTTTVQHCTGITSAVRQPYSQAKRPSKMTSGYHFEVFGKVQGVFFRANSADEAKRLGVVGWVRNTPTGSVEGEAQGSHQQLESFKDWLTHKGSPGCRIDRCEITRESRNLDRLEYTDFEVRR